MTQQQGSSFGNPNDPWITSSGNYDPTNFYTRATDGNGHDTTVTTKVSPALLGEIQRLIQSRSIPEYRTNGDLVRDALIHRLRYLNDEYPGSVNLHAIEIEQRQAELDRMKIERESWTKLLNDLGEQLDSLIGMNELDEAEWLMDANEWNESMTPPYLLRLSKLLSKYRAEVADARRSALR
jgi:hypothetical protein